MNQKELNEIRRHLHPERTNISHIYGCFVNAQKEIISYIDESVGLLTNDEKEKYLTFLKKSISGSLGKNLLDVSFSSRQVMEGEDHALLMNLLKSRLEDKSQREQLYKKIISSFELEDSNYVVLMGCDSYDIPFKNKTGEDDADRSEEVFNFILCSICPVKEGKSELGFDPAEKRFGSSASEDYIAAPAVGFMFPCFDGRTANIYNVLYYSKDTNDIHDGLMDSLFKTEPPMSPGQQRDSFSALLKNSLEDECSFEVVHSIREQFSGRIAEHKESKNPEVLTVCTEDIGDMLRESGVSREHIAAFKEKCEEAFGEYAQMCPVNLIETKKIEIATPRVNVSVDPEYSYLVEARLINGRKFIVVSAEEGISLNGVDVTVKE